MDFTDYQLKLLLSELKDNLHKRLNTNSSIIEFIELKNIIDKLENYERQQRY